MKLSEITNQPLHEGQVIPFKQPKSPTPGYVFSGTSMFMNRYATKILNRQGIKILSIRPVDTELSDLSDQGHDSDVVEVHVEGPDQAILKADADFYHAQEMLGLEDAYGGYYPASHAD